MTTYGPEADQLKQKWGQQLKVEVAQGNNINQGWQIQLIDMQPTMTYISSAASNELLYFVVTPLCMAALCYLMNPLLCLEPSAPCRDTHTHTHALMT